MSDVRLLQGDCRDVLKTLPDGSVNCCVTSPPYYGLRDYGVDGQIGLEQTPDAYVAELVAVFAQVKRVLRADGTLWLNLGDSYNAYPGQRKDTDRAGGKQQSVRGSTAAPSRNVAGIKPKDLIGIPWMVAFALRADGWYLRQDIIWHKPNPMPESVTDRCTKAHEYVFLMSKSERYHFDHKAITEPSTQETGRGGKNAFRGQGHMRDGESGPANREGRDMRDVGVGDTRNKRSVWTVNTRPYKGSHFATFPPSLIRPMILAGCPHGGTVLDPFGGSGTTGQVAEEEERNAVLIELNPEYVGLQKKRTQQIGMMLQ